jgi:Repeat of unknown function (DUF5648)
MANKYIQRQVSKFARAAKQLFLIGGLALLASCGGDAALQAEQAVQTFNKQVIKLDTERHSLLSSLYSTAKVKGGVTPSGKVVTNAELLAQNPAVLKMVGAEKTLAKPQRVQSQALVSSTFSPVFRIQNGDLPGSYFFTIYESERVAALASNPNWTYEGPAFYTSQTEEGGLSPVWRFRNLINGSYVFTIYESERQSIVNDYSSTFAYEGVSWYARQTEALGFTPLYRFRNIKNGTYLFSAYESEKVAILQNYADTFVYEGVAYYVQVPGGTSATPPAMQVTDQTAVLKSSVITGIDASLTKVDQIGNFTAVAGRTWAKDQVFMYQGRAYKVVGVIVNADGTSSLSTKLVSLDQAYDALSFKFKAHSLAYGTDNQALPADQVAAAATAQTAYIQSMSKGFEVARPQTLATSQAGFNFECFVPKLTTEGAVTPSGNEWGYSFEFNNCSLNQLLQLDNSYPTMNIYINGDVTASGEIDYEYNLEEGTNYTETSQTASIGLTFSGALSDAARTSLKNSEMCKNKDGMLECEKIASIYKPTVPFMAGPVPIMYEVGIGFTFTVDINGTFTIKKQSTIVTKKGYKNNVYYDGKPESTNLNGGRTTAEFTTKLEADLFVFGAFDLGVGAEAGDIEAYILKIESKAGIFGNLLYTPDPSHCLSFTRGGRVKVDVKALKIGNITLLNWEDTLNFPYDVASVPLDCTTEGKIHIGYSMTGSQLYKFNSSASLDLLDVYDAGKDLITNTSDGGRLRIDLSTTKGIIGKNTGFEVSMRTGTTSSASLDRIDASAPGADSFWARAFINPGNSTYGDVIKFRIKAFDPSNRPATESFRDVEIRIEPALQATPKYSTVIGTSGNESYWAEYNYGGAGQTAAQTGSGYLQMVGASNLTFSSVSGSLPTVNELSLYNADQRAYLRPQRLALLSKLDRAGSEQFFNFVELTDVVISSVNISPAEPTVGNLATFTITGDRMPANLAVNIPNCSTPVEVRSAGNIAKNNYSTEVRVFTCTPNASGEVVTATFGPNNFAKTFRIPPQTCPAGQTVVNGVCTTTAVTAVISISPTTATLNTPTEFTITGTNLPLTAQLVIGTWANCLTPINRTANGFKQTCTPAGATGLVFVTVMTNSIANGGSVIHNILTVNVIAAPVAAGIFSVPANLQTGYQFTVPAGAINCTFNASGNWMYSPGLAVSAEGNASYTNNPSYPRLLATSPYFSLIAATSNGYVFVGSSKTMTVSAGSNLVFQINEGIGTGDSYADNSGSLSVSYICSNTPVNAGSITVAANTIPGGTFQVPSGATSCQLSATGTWAAGPNAPLSSQTADGAVGSNALDLASRGAPLPSAAVGALVVRHSSNSLWELVGSSKTISVSSLENLTFMMNDATDYGYTDGNIGSLAVTYSCN